MAEDTAQPTATKTEPAKGKGKKKAKKKKAAKKAAGATKFGQIGYPKHPILKCLRIPQGVVENNAGKECTDREAAKFAGLGWSGGLKVEISSAIKYGLFERPSPGHVKPTDLIRNGHPLWSFSAVISRQLLRLPRPRRFFLTPHLKSSLRPDRGRFSSYRHGSIFRTTYWELCDLTLKHLLDI